LSIRISNSPPSASRKTLAESSQKMHKTTTDNITKWKITLDANGKKSDIAEFEFFIENGKVWLNNCWVDESLRNKGIGKYIIITAIEEYEEIYFSSAEKGQHKRKNIENDTRYIEPTEGVDFVNSLLKKEIIKKEWFINPFDQ
jgi:GNAT superfamily N-acetyltransferase